MKLSKKLFLSIITIFLVALIGILLFKPTLIGLVTKEKLETYTQTLNQTFTSPANYVWQPEYFGTIKSVKISGSLSGEGHVRIFIEDSLIFEGDATNESLLFTEVCIDSCDLSETLLNSSNYTLRIESTNASITIDSITYTLSSQEEIGDYIEESKNEDLSQSQPQAILTEPIVVGQPVKWKKTVEIKEQKSHTLSLPEKASGIVLEKSNNGERGITESPEFQEQESHDNKEITFDAQEGTYTINYETPAPEIKETQEEGKKVVEISGPDELNYTDITTFTNLSESFKIIDYSVIHLYWIVDGEQVEHPFTAKDLDFNGYLDYIEWTTPHLSNQTFEIIVITKAEHLDENRTLISDIYDSVKELDDVWSETISDGEYARVTFEIPLDSSRDITLYPRVISGEPTIEVYEKDGNDIIASFPTLISYEYNKVYLDKLAECYDNDAEILTENGWKLFDDVNDGEMVMTLNGSSGEQQWEMPMERQAFNSSGEMYKIILEDGSEMVVSEKHKVYASELNGPFGNSLNPDCESINSLPLNSGGLTVLNNLNNADKTDLIIGGCILTNTIPEYFLGGNKSVLAKCLSNVTITLLSEFAKEAICSSGVWAWGTITLNPSSLSNLTNKTGKFSSHNNDGLLESCISLFMNDSRSIIQGSENSLFGELRKIVCQDFLNADSCSKQLNNLPDHDSCAFESRLSVANLTVCNDVLIDFDSHNGGVPNSVYKDCGRNSLEGEMVVSEKHKVYASAESNRNKSFVDNILTDFCCVNALSSDQIGTFSDSASAKYEASLLCGDNLEASGKKCSYSCLDDNSNCLVSNFHRYENSSSLIQANRLIFSLSESISSKANSVEQSLTSRFTNSLIACLLAESDLKNENKILASGINNLGMGSIAYYDACLLTTRSFKSEDNFSTCSSVNLDLESMESAIENSMSVTSLFNALASATVNNSLNSLGTSTLTTISSINNLNKGSYINILKDFSLQKVTDVYSQVQQGNTTYFLNSQNQPVKIRSIEKVPYTGKIYDVDVHNDIVLVKRGDGNAFWSGNSNPHTQDTFDLRVVGGSVEFDHIIDPQIDPSSETGLIALYHFNNESAYGENDTFVYDFSDNGNNGTVSGGAGWNLSGGILGTGAYQFDGIDDFINVTDNNLLSFGNGLADSPMSIAAWINMQEANEFKIITKGTAYPDLEYYFRTGDQGGNLDKLILRIYDKSSGAAIGRMYDTSLSSYEGQWIHVVATYNGSSTSDGIKLYLNGNRVDDTNYEYSSGYVAMENLGDLSIGTYNGYFANGSIDEVAIYNRALNESEVLALYQTTSTGEYLYDCGALSTPNKQYYLARNVTSNGTCFTILANNITLDGNGFMINYSANGTVGYGVDLEGYNVTTIKNINILAGTSSANYNVYLLKAYNNTLSNLIINSRNIGVFLSSSSNNSINNLTISTNNNNAYGLDLSFGSNDNWISNLNISTSENNADGVKFWTGSNNTLTNITIKTMGSGAYGVSFGADSYSNSLNNLVIRTSGSSSEGINLGPTSGGNQIINSNITTTGSDAHGASISFSLGNTLKDVRIEAMNNSWGVYLGIDANLTQFINPIILTNKNAIKDESEDSCTNYLLFNNSLGQVKWTNTVNGGFLKNLTINQMNFSYPEHVYVGNNSVFVNSTYLSGGKINSSANITLFGLSQSFTNPVILKDSVECTDCYNFTSLNAGTVVFNVSSWSNYSIGEEPSDPTQLTTCGNLTVAGATYTLMNDIDNWNGDCFTISADNITLDGNGKYIDGTQNKTAYWGVYALGRLNLTIKNLTIQQFGDYNKQSSYNGGGVYFESTNYSLVKDINASSGNYYGAKISYCSNNNLSQINSVLNRYGISFLVSSNNNLEIATVNLNSNNGISLDSSSYNTLQDITSSLNTLYGISLDSSSYNNLSLITSSSNNQDGIYFASSSNNNIQNITSGSNLHHGIYFSGSNSNILNYAVTNLNTLYGISLDSSSYNNLSLITSSSNGNYGINIFNSDSNTFNSGTINASKQDSIYLVNSISLNNSFINISITNTNISYFDIFFNDEGINGTQFIDMPHIGNYSFTGVGGTIIVKKTNYGEIKFIQPVNGSGTNFSRDIQIGNNSVFVNASSNQGLNRSANITLYGLGTFTNPRILKDGAVCTDCYNFTSLNAGTVIFNVSSWSNYSIGENPAVYNDSEVSTCRVLNVSGQYYWQTANIVPTGAIDSCINITASNVTFDGNGKWISNVTLAANGIKAYNVRNITIKNANVTMQAAFESNGIYLYNVNNSVILNTSVNSNYYGINLWNSFNNNLSSIIANSNSMHGIYAQSNSNNNQLNNIIANSNSQNGVYLSQSSNNQLNNIIVNSNSFYGLILVGSLYCNISSITLNSNNNGLYLSTSDNNNISSITLNSNILRGIDIWRSSNNSLNNGQINSSGQDAIHLDTLPNSRNIFTNISITNTNTSYYDFNIATASINSTQFIDLPSIGNYSFTGVGGTIIVKKTGLGEIRFIQPVNGSGTNFSRDIQIGNNSVFVNASSNRGLNRSANITLYGLGTFSNPRILKDGAICGDCYNFTSLNAGTVVFNVSSWSNYSVGEEPAAPDTTPPSINFTFPTPANASNQTSTSIYVNVTSNDSSEHYSFVDFDKSLVLWMRMDDVNASGDPTDLSSWSNNGTKMGNANQASDGKFGEAFEFDAGSDFIDLPDSSILMQNNTFTISAWINSKNINQQSQVILSSEEPDSPWAGFIFLLNRNILTCAIGDICMWVSDYNTGNYEFYDVPHGLTQNNTWYLVTIVWDSIGKNATFYVNGAPIGSDTGSYIIAYDPTASDFRIGKWAIDGGVFNGSIDEVLIFNRSLSADEIKSLYNATAYQYQNNFTSLSAGNHTFTAYAVDTSGNKNQTEQRVVSILQEVNDSEVSSCRVLSTPNTYYTQTANIVPTGDAPCINITASNITFDGNGKWIANSTFGQIGIYANNLENISIKNVNVSIGSSASGIYFESINNSNIFNSTFSFNGIGIEIYKSSNNHLADITANSNNQAGLTMYTNSNNNQLLNITANSNNWDGIYLISISNNTFSFINANLNSWSGFAFLSCSNNYLSSITANSNSLKGLGFTSSINNYLSSITANSNLYDGIYFSSSSDNNQFNNFVANSNKDNGINLDNSLNNSFVSGIINASKQDAIYYISSPTNSENIFTNITISNTNSSYRDIYFAAESINSTSFIDMPSIANYSFTGVGGTIIVKKTGLGEIRFIQPVNGSGTNFSNDIRIGNNSVYVNSAQTGLNKSANITLYGLGTFTNPRILKDGAICGDCYNFTDLNAGTVVFNVSSWSNYSVGEEPSAPQSWVNVTNCSDLTSANTEYRLINNVTSNSTCFTILANNVTLDGQGFEINYSANGTVGYGISVVGFNFSTIKNALIVGGNGGYERYAIYLVSSSNNTLRDNNINTVGRCVELNSNSQYNLILNNTFVSSATSAGVGISLGWSANKNIIINNTLQTIASTVCSNCYGIVIASVNNTLENNLISTLSLSPGVFLNTAEHNILTRNSINTTSSVAIYITGTTLAHFNHTIDTSNLAEGKPILFNFSLSNQAIRDINSSQYGQIICAWCANVTYDNVTMLNGEGISLVNNTGSKVINSNFTTNNGYGVFIYLNSFGNVIENNTINTNTASNLYGVYISGSTYNNVTGNYINATTYGIWLYSSANQNIVKNNIVNTAGGRSITVQTSDNNLIINNSVLSGQYGMDIGVGSKNNQIINNSINVNGYGMIIGSGSNNNSYIQINMLARSFPGIYMWDSNHNFTFIDSIVNSTTNQNLYVRSAVTGGTFNFTNTTRADGTPINVSWSAGANGTLIMNYYADIQVNYSNGTAVANAQVNATDIYNSIASTTTDSNGKARLILTEYIRNNTSGTDYTYFSNYSILATEGFQSSSSSLNMSTNRFIQFTLQSEDLVYPSFNNYWDNNASITSGGTAWFNVTILNTNGTVIMNINGTNYSASNTSLNNFNVSINGLTNGTYSYYWISYGNGTSHLFNISDVRYYTVNATPDTTYPTFSNYGDNNASITSGGTAWFNVTIQNTNGTVILSINGTNYSVSNITLNNYNVSLSGLPNGTYSYYWGAFGSGTNHLYNVSGLRSYTVNATPDTTYPAFSNYGDNNASITSGGTALFNVTLLNTNGTVIMNINGTNFTATNSSLNNYNVTVIGLVNGTYSYYWSAYGNGTSRLYNVSETRYYAVNVTPDTTYPVFTNYGDNNASITSGGLAWFNVTIQNTNGTVTLSINGTNYTSSNMSLNNYNVSIAGLSNGTYTYFWSAYGNGTSHLYNISDIRYYTVNNTPPDTAYPVFTSFGDNNASIISGGIVWFNVSIINTNGTVILTLNETNYSVSNSSASVYNYSLYLTQGIYTYFWSAYGNGSDRLYNVSSMRYYTVLSDTTLPVVNLIAPSNGEIINISQVSFNASFSDNINLSYVTLHVWNSSGWLVNQTNRTISGESGSANISFIIPYSGEFTWNYLAADSSGNSAFNNTNYSITYSPPDTTPPVLTVLRPNTTSISATEVYFSIGSNENLSSCVYSLNNWLTNLSMEINGSLTGANATNYSIAEGTYTAQFACNDSHGNLNNTLLFVFTLDITPPDVTINLPTNATYTASPVVPISISINENGTCLYSINGGVTNISLSTTNNILFTGNTASLTNTQYMLNAYCYDLAGNINLSESINFSVNYVAPSTPKGGGKVGGGGGGGGTTPPTNVSNKTVTIIGKTFVIDKKEISIKIKQGENKKEELWITNIDKKTINISLSLEDNENLVRLSESRLALLSGESKDVTLEVVASDTITPKNYLRKLEVQSGSEVQEVLLSIDISSHSGLFDVKIEIQPEKKEILPGQSLDANIQLLNFGTLGRVDAQLIFSIVDENGNEIYESGEAVAVETQVGMIRRFELPKDATPGKYRLVVTAKYGNETAVASGNFTVLKESIPRMMLLIIGGGIILATIIIFIMVRVIHGNKEKEFKEKRKREADIYSISMFKN